MNRRQLLAGGAAAAAVGPAWSLGVEPRWVEVTRHPLPGAAAPLRIVQLTDVHLRSVHPAARAVAAALDAEPPDLLVLTGDIVESPAALPELTAWLADLRFGQAVATLGNWEHWGDVSRMALEAAYARAGVALLVDEAQRLALPGGPWSVVGLDDAVARPDPVAAWRDAARDGPQLLLAHSPGDLRRIASAIAAAGVRAPALSLSGHTHGGQVRVPGVPPVLPPHSGRFVAGWYDAGGWPAYVSRGVGTSVVPARFACRPEVACFSAPGPLAAAAGAG